MPVLLHQAPPQRPVHRCLQYQLCVKYDLDVWLC